MKCILLCAGYATRLYPLTKNFPKALLEIEPGKCILDYILDEVCSINEVDDIFVVSNHVFYNHFCEWASSQSIHKKLIVIDDHTTSNADRLGAIGDIYYTIKNQCIDDDLLIIAGDNLFDYSLKNVVNFFYDKKAPVVCGKELHDVSLLQRLAVAKVDCDDKIVHLVEKPEHPDGNVAVYATYLYPKEVLKEFQMYLDYGNMPDAPGYFVQYLYSKVPVYVYRFDGHCFDVGTPEALDEVRLLYKDKKFN